MSQDNVAQYDVDRPGHTQRVSIVVRAGRADDISPDQPTTFLQLHGNIIELIKVVDALAAAGWPPFSLSELANCQPRFGCYHAYALVDGYMNAVDIKAALTAIGDPDHMPYDMPLPHERG